jgi:heptaprenyl diphosphate synthase
MGTEAPIDHHLSVLQDKTGSLIATACRFGAMMAGAPAEQVEALARFGERIGVAFQLADDLVDISSESAESGKTPGTDLREGVATLALLIARQSAEPEDARWLDLTDGPIPDDDQHSGALAWLRAHPALEQARNEARNWAMGARAELTVLPGGPARDVLEQLCDYVVARTG